MTESPRVRPDTSDIRRSRAFVAPLILVCLAEALQDDVISAPRGCTSHPAPDARHTLPKGATHLSILRCHS